MRFSVPRMRPNCACRVFSTKLRIVVYNFAHQLFDQLQADRTILTASEFRDRLGDGDNGAVSRSAANLNIPTK